MYEANWPIALLIYYIVLFIVAFAWRSLLVYRRSGVNPLVLPSSADAYGYVARGFKVTIAGIAAVVIAMALWPAFAKLFRPLDRTEQARICLRGMGVVDRHAGLARDRAGADGRFVAHRHR